MPFRIRKSVRFGPARLNLSRSGVSLSERLGAFTYSTRRGWSARIVPGLSWYQGRRKRR